MFKISVPSKYVPGNKDFMVFTDAGNPGTDSTPPRIAFFEIIMFFVDGR